MKTQQLWVVSLSCLLLISCSHITKNAATQSSTMMVAPIENPNFISNVRQFTFGGSRSGEGYFSRDGELMIFQSEREANNPFYQMYLKDLKSGEVTRVSPGIGKTTCGWIDPSKKSVTFSSTHLDPKSKNLQQTELENRKNGPPKRYSWDYDEHYDIFRADLKGKHLVNLTHTLGYDAESSISPDGTKIAFASNRQAYKNKLSDEDKKRLSEDPAFFMDIYVMNSDGTHVTQLTQSPGYDGGPFFSPDGKRIIWRRFTPDGLKAEIFTMKIDGTDEKQITHLNAMSWAPFYHPSGDYIIFTTNLLGFQNFELYAVDAAGTQPPVRVSYLDGFDGLPVFAPDGKKLTWNRKLSATESQIMIADWNDTLIRSALHLPPASPRKDSMSQKITIPDLKTVVQYLASKELKGRYTGSVGEIVATQNAAQYFNDIGLSPFNGKDYIQNFEFQNDASLGEKNSLTVEGTTQQNLDLDKNWRPLAFSKTGTVPASSIVFAGYGIRAPAEDKMLAYDSYSNLDVKNKWVMVLRYAPESTSPERRLFLQRYSKLEHKAMMARDLGARGIIFVSGPNAHAKSDLISFKRVTGPSFSIPAISLSDDMASQMFSLLQKDMGKTQTELDKEIPFVGFEIPNLKLAASIDIRIEKGQAHNALGFLKVPGAKSTLIIGAHIDHLGDHPSDDSLKTNLDSDPIHYGADDNASGVAAVFELAHYFTDPKIKSLLKQNLLFATWSGEELGDLGSTYFAQNIKKTSIHPNAYINMDMIGRWKKVGSSSTYEPLTIQGVGSGDKWREIVESLQLEFPVQLQNDPYLPTDSMSFYLAKIPTINFFTGAHLDYHTPRDTESKINYDGLFKITNTIASLIEKISKSNTLITYQNVPRTLIDIKSNRGFRIFLGTIPDYTKTDVKGVALSGVITGGPAEKAGMQAGDIVIEFSNKKIENIHDYVYTLETARPNESTKIVVLRNGKRESIDITPLAKE
jgi:Tol biopolymer transport system component